MSHITIHAIHIQISGWVFHSLAVILNIDTESSCTCSFLFIADLSFNNIEVIEGLDKLVKLKDLTLFNNRISKIENMDSLTQLHVFSVGNNSLKQLDNVSN